MCVWGGGLLWGGGESGAFPVTIATASRGDERRDYLYSLRNRWDIKE